jgi:hypothetical protein
MLKKNSHFEFLRILQIILRIKIKKGPKFFFHLKNMFGNNSLYPSLNKLLDSLGFEEWTTITCSFILPIISLIGIILCSISFYIYCQEKFNESSFFFYRLLCLTNIFQLIHNIPFGLLFSPRYFPLINTYLSSIFLIYYLEVSALIYQYEDVIQMAILLDRIAILSPYVKRHFTAKPWLISLLSFFACLLINISNGFSLEVKSFGTYVSHDDSSGVKRNETFFYFTSSEFSLTLHGQIYLAFNSIFLHLFLTLVFGITLNIVSVFKYMNYLKQKLKRENETYREWFKNTETSMGHIEQAVQVFRQHSARRDLNERKVKRKMFYLSLTQCSISIITRIFVIISYVYYYFFGTFSVSLSILTILMSIYTFVPTVAIFVFYFFNKKFRKEFQKRILKRNT